MKIFSIIAGIVLILFGIGLMATPLVTFLSMGYYIIILFIFSGLMGIIRGILQRNFGMEFIFAILSLILGIAGMAIPGAALMNDLIILYMSAFWFVIRGVLSIYVAIQSRKLGAGTGVMVLGILLGILDLVVGVYSFAHPTVMALTLGILIGIDFIESGINMICLGSIFSQLQQFAERFRGQGGGSMRV